jgi:hypothetical protein
LKTTKTVDAQQLEGDQRIIHALNRLGFGPRAGFEGIDRITSDDSFLYLTFGLAAVASIDLVDKRGFRLALAVRPTAEYATQFALLGAGDSAGIFGGTASLEFRWRAPRRAPKPKPQRLATSEDAAAFSAIGDRCASCR